ncbi:MAG: hypothetical protein AAGH19_09295 [Pseudomonadota bacterium]
MPTRFLSRAAILLLAATLSACSWFKEKPPEYLESREAEPLRVPEDLDAPVYRTPLVISAPEMRMPAGDELNPGPPRAVSTGGRGDANAYIAWSAEGVYLSVADSPESVYRRLGFAIERTGMRPLPAADSGDQRFEYVHIRYDDRSFWQKLAFWNDGKGPDYSGVYQARVTSDGGDARVYLQLDSGAPADTSAAEHILGIFMERLG